MDKKGIGGVIVLIFIGLFFGSFGILPVLDHHHSVQEFEPTTAEVQSTDIIVTEDSDGDKSYNPVVVYEYTVDGETYTNKNTYPGSFTRKKSSRGGAQDVTSQYQPGDEVTIHYNPKNPEASYLRNDGMPGMWFIGAIYGVIALFAGIHYVRVGFRRRKQRELIKDTPTEEAESLSIGSSEVKGTAVTDDRPPGQAPFSDEECVLAKYEIKEYHDDSDDDGGSWRTRDEGVIFMPFYVDDGTGKVLVKPHEDATYDLDPDDWHEEYVDSSSRGPGPIQQFVEASDDIGFPSDRSGKDNDRKYRQNLIKTGESCYVFGTVQPREDPEPGASNEERLVIKKVEEGDGLMEPMFMISDDSEKGLITRRKFALWRLPVGSAFVIAAVAIFVGLFGPKFGVTLPILI